VDTHRSPHNQLPQPLAPTVGPFGLLGEPTHRKADLVWRIRRKMGEYRCEPHPHPRCAGIPHINVILSVLNRPPATRRPLWSLRRVGAGRWRPSRPRCWSTRARGWPRSPHVGWPASSPTAAPPPGEQRGAGRGSPPCDAYSSLEGPGSHLEDRVRIPLPLKHLCTTGHRITGGHRQCLAVQCAILITCHRTTHHRRPAVEPPREVVHPTACSPLRSPAGLLSRDLGTWWMLTTHFQTMSDTLALCFISYQNIKLFRERRR